MPQLPDTVFLFLFRSGIDLRDIDGADSFQDGDLQSVGGGDPRPDVIGVFRRFLCDDRYKVPDGS